MKEEKYNTGDVLKKTAMYAANYPKWEVETGTLLLIKTKVIADGNLGAVDKAMFRARYGIQKEYPLFEMIISTSDGDKMVSQFGFNKDLQ